MKDVRLVELGREVHRFASGYTIGLVVGLKRIFYMAMHLTSCGIDRMDENIT